MVNSWNLYKNLHQISSHPQWNPLMIQGWWVTGGLVNSSGSATPTTELFNSSSGTFVKGPDLPFALHKHCLVHIAAGWARSIVIISNFVIFGHLSFCLGKNTKVGLFYQTYTSNGTMFCMTVIIDQTHPRHRWHCPYHSSVNLGNKPSLQLDGRVLVKHRKNRWC